ncbi:MAG: BlaI/MecI/CopY family transcriptional regulator [Pseudomonadales bacterium]|nr:BlaI/MecI/CopY family transcriptional regulator [Pseudomonadales bacterium]
MASNEHINLTRRERQIMDVLYARERATAAEILADLPDSPSYSTVRALLRKLLDKGHIDFAQDGPRYLYHPVLKKSQASANALRRLLDTFYAGSTGAAVMGLLGQQGEKLSPADIARIEAELNALKARKR